MNEHFTMKLSGIIDKVKPSLISLRTIHVNDGKLGLVIINRQAEMTNDEDTGQLYRGIERSQA